SNAYALFGTVNSIEVAPGARMQFCLNDAPPDVGPTAKEIDLSGTGTDTIQIGIGLG
ncbi:MAG: hypothetical protein HUJ11_07875, partial [Arenibacter algicola]|nr:hypothetical protein [Arenibacter algicola]